jgi:Icc-related predicted phosphoesterase
MVNEDHSMIPVELSTPNPWKTPHEVSEEMLGKMIEEILAKVPDMNEAIFNFRGPSTDSTLAWMKDPPRQISRGGQSVIYGASSSSVRAAIEKYGPIPEAQSVAKIGRTMCINPGSEYGDGFLRGFCSILWMAKSGGIR